MFLEALVRANNYDIKLNVRTNAGDNQTEQKLNAQVLKKKGGGGGGY